MQPLKLTPLHRFAVFLLFATLACQAAFAQTTGAVAGRVSEAATGRSLQGAVVRVLGTTLVDYTDADGRFNLPRVPGGTQRIEVDYVGLDPYIREVTVGGSGLTAFDATLESKALQMQAFTVAETARGQALAINQQKTASGIVNVVSEETFGQMINGNIGYALERLPGLTVSSDEDGTPSGVNIRGLSSAYNSFQIDGNRAPTSGGSRGFGTGQLTADGISTIEVIKAPTPDRDGDAVGGIINVVSRSAFMRDGRELRLNASGTYYDLSGNWGHNFGATYSDILSLGGQAKNFGFSLTATTYRTSRDYDNLDKDYALLRPANEPALGITEPIYFHTNGAPQTNRRTSTAYGLNGSFDYRLSERATFYFKPLYTHTNIEGEKPRVRLYVNSNHNYAGPTGTKSIAEASYNTGRSLPNITTEYRYQNDESDSDNDLYSLAAGGRHALDTIVWTYDAFYSENARNNNRALNYVVRNPGFNIGYDHSNHLKPVYTILNGKSPYDLSTVNRGDFTINPSDKTEEAYSFKTDWEKKFPGSELSGAFKAGLKYRGSQLDQDQNERLYRTGSNASGFPYASVLKRVDYDMNGTLITMVPDLPKVEELFRTSPHLFTAQAADIFLNQRINDFAAEENTSAAYVMGTLNVGKTTLIGGLRAEKNEFSSSTYEFKPAAGAIPASFTRVDRERDYTVWLPGLHLRHPLRPNLILRGSYNRSYARPELDSLLRGRTIDFGADTIEDGNPDLDPTTSHNFDAQVEYYTRSRGLYSAGVFYKKMKGFYYDDTSRTEDIFDDIEGVTKPFRVTRPDNALGATNYGIELIARQKLFFLPKPFDGFGISLSATFTDSDGKYPGRLTEKLPTYGFSDTIFYSALEYTIGKFRAQVSYRYRTEYLEGLDVDDTFDDWFAAREQVDIESSWQLTRKVRLFLNVENATARPQVSYQGFNRTDNPEDFTQYGFRAVAGMNLTF
ncbi:MAG: TonB-dependent receptor [Verrucomicrobiota bacterium]